VGILNAAAAGAATSASGFLPAPDLDQAPATLTDKYVNKINLLCPLSQLLRPAVFTASERFSHYAICSRIISFSAVLGDAFHHMDRAKVPVHHSFKNGFFVALRRAWFMFEPTAYEALKAKLRAGGLTDK